VQSENYLFALFVDANKDCHHTQKVVVKDALQIDKPNYAKYLEMEKDFVYSSYKRSTLRSKRDFVVIVG
jgi:hypothetical protein